MTRTRRFLHGVGVNYVQQAVTLLGGLWLMRFLLQQVGQDDYGTWLAALQALAYVELIDLGVVSLLPREIAYATGAAAGTQDRDAAAAPVVCKVRRLVLLQWPVVAAIGAGAWCYLEARAGADAGALGLIVLAYALQFPFRIYPATLQGLQDLAFLGWTRAGLWLLQAGVTVGCVLAGLGMWALAIGWSIQQLLLPLAGWLRLRLAFPRAATAAASALTRAEAGRYLRRSSWVTVSGLAQVLLNGTDVLLVQALLGPAAVVVYVCTAKLVNILAVQTYTLVLTAEPALSELRAAGQASRVAQVGTALRELMLLASGLVACVVLSTNEGFVTWWVGTDWYAGNGLTYLLLATMMARHLTFTLGHLLFCCGYERALAVLGVLDGTAAVAGGLLLIPHLGLAGAALGSLLAVVLLHLPACLCLLARDSQLSLLALARAHRPWVLRFVPLAAGLGLLGWVWKPADLLSLTLTGLGVCLAYVLLMIPAVRRSPLWPYFRPRLARWWPALAGTVATAPTDQLAELSS
jgi:O-antigen/teichoic acid export membrane protein